MLMKLIRNLELESKLENKEGISEVREELRGYRYAEAFIDFLVENNKKIMEEVLKAKESYKNTKSYKSIEDSIQTQNIQYKIVHYIFKESKEGILKYNEKGQLKPQSFTASFKRAIKYYNFEEFNISIPNASENFQSYNYMSFSRYIPNYLNFNWLEITDEENYSKAVNTIVTNALIDIIYLMEKEQNKYFNENDETTKKYQEIDEFQNYSNIVLDENILNGKNVTEERLNYVYDNMLKIKEVYDKLIKIGDSIYNEE